MRFLLLLAMLTFTRELAAEENQPVHGRGFSFFCPRSWKVEKSSPADFNLYHLESPSGDKLLIYEGNAADFLEAGSSPKPEQAKIGGRPALIIKVASADELRFEVLIETGSPDWPTQIHLICRPTTRAALTEMERLVDGLIVRENFQRSK